MAPKELNIILLLLAEFLTSLASPQKKDDTLTDLAFGKDVTEATIRKIIDSKIFPDHHGFLTRLAYVENRFGDDSSTFRSNYTGGIWQVDEAVFNATKSSNLTPFHTAIYAKFQVNWLDLTWKSCLAPMYSALSAALYFSQITPSIPEKINDQAAHWKQFYRPFANDDVFIQDSEKLGNESVCRGKLDLAIALDGSVSVAPADFVLSKNFVPEIIESFSLNHTKIGTLVYSTTITDTFETFINLTIPEMADHIRNSFQPSVGSKSDLKIFQMFDLQRNVKRAHGFSLILAIFTNGTEEYEIVLTSVGIQSGISHDDLRLIDIGQTNRVFNLSDHEKFQNFLFGLTTTTCATPHKITPNKSLNDTLIQKERRIFEIPVPDSGLTIRLSTTAGNITVYWSKTERVPNSAVHDGVIDGVIYVPSASSLTKIKAYRHRGETDETEDVAPTSVFVAIEGVESTNNYTFWTLEGSHLPNGVVSTKTVTNSLVLFTFAFLVSIFQTWI